jgi:hypothetical protein
VAVNVPSTSSKSFLSLRDYVERTYGAGSFERVRARLTELGMPIDRVITPMGWYPTTTYAAALDAGRDLFGPENFAEQFGYAAAEYELNFFLRFLLRFTSPVWILQRGADVWRRYHDTGEWEIVGFPHRIRGALRGFGIAHDGYCRSLVGWLRRACELTGAREVTVRHLECRTRGAEACVFEGHWR